MSVNNLEQSMNNKEQILRAEIKRLVNEVLSEADEGQDLEKELSKVGTELAAAIKKADIDVSELEEKYQRAIDEGADKNQLNEIVIETITAILLKIMTVNAIIGLITKGVKFLSKKLNWQKGEDFAEKILHYVHEVEAGFKKPLDVVLKLFVKDAQTRKSVVNIMYAILVASLAVGYGTEAIQSLKDAEWFSGGVKGLKVLAKSDEVMANLKNPIIVKAIKAFA